MQIRKSYRAPRLSSGQATIAGRRSSWRSEGNRFRPGRRRGKGELTMLRPDRKPLRGSGRVPAPGAQRKEGCPPSEIIEVTVRTRGKSTPQVPFPATLLSAEEIGVMRLKERKYVSREEYAALLGASPTDLQAVRA